MGINRELIKGSTSILILKLLAERDMYGYQITQELKARSDNELQLKEGTLYPMLHSLTEAGAVEWYWYDTDEGRRRKYYKITDTGREMLNKKRREWKEFSKLMNGLIDGPEEALS